jgi:hypothetical protein
MQDRMTANLDQALRAMLRVWKHPTPGSCRKDDGFHDRHIPPSPEPRTERSTRQANGM